ncbi:hypothetical protein Dimus_029668 [Dionaea muscipula]
MEELSLLSLMGNNLTGEIPLEISNLKSLQVLHLWNNSLTGSLPHRLGSNGRLQKLDVSSNHLTGPLPSSSYAQLPAKVVEATGEVMVGAVRCRWSSMEAVQLALNDDGIFLEISLAGVAGVHVVDGGLSNVGQCWQIWIERVGSDTTLLR